MGGGVTDSGMPSNVVSLSGEPIPAGQPVEAVVERAHWLLQAAASGEINGIGAVLHWRDGSTTTISCGMASFSQVGRLLSLATALAAELEKP